MCWVKKRIKSCNGIRLSNFSKFWNFKSFYKQPFGQANLSEFPPILWSIQAREKTRQTQVLRGKYWRWFKLARICMSIMVEILACGYIMFGSCKNSSQKASKKSSIQNFIKNHFWKICGSNRMLILAIQPMKPAIYWKPPSRISPFQERAMSICECTCLCR